MGRERSEARRFRRRERSCRRWQLLICGWIYEVPRTSACTPGFATHVESHVAPRVVSSESIEGGKFPGNVKKGKPGQMGVMGPPEWRRTLALGGEKRGRRETLLLFE